MDTTQGIFGMEIRHMTSLYYYILFVPMSPPSSMKITLETSVSDDYDIGNKLFPMMVTSETNCLMSPTSNKT